MSMKYKRNRLIPLYVIPFIVAGAVMLLLSVYSCQEKGDGSKSRMTIGGRMPEECKEKQLQEE